MSPSAATSPRTSLAKLKRAAEKRLESSRLDYTVLLPSYFADVWLTPAVGFDVAGGKVRIYGDGKAKGSYVTGDLHALAAALDATTPSS